MGIFGGLLKKLFIVKKREEKPIGTKQEEVLPEAEETTQGDKDW